MPVIGHAVAGFMLASIISTDNAKKQKNDFWQSSLQLPFLLLLSYWPDIWGYIFQTAGWQNARLAGHSLLSAIFFALPASFLARVFFKNIPISHCYGLAFLTVSFHDILDLFQSTDRYPLWPLSQWNINSDFAFIPDDPANEALLFGALSVLFLLSSYFLRPRHTIRQSAKNIYQAHISTWISRILVALIICSALLTLHLRSAGEKEMQHAHHLLNQRRYGVLLKKLDAIEHGWPPVAKPGRIDYLRGVAFWKIGETEKGEFFLLRSYKADPGYFWCVGDLALFYASLNIEQGKKLKLMSPFLQHLQMDFGNHHDYKSYIDKIQKLILRENDKAENDSTTFLFSF